MLSTAFKIFASLRLGVKESIVPESDKSTTQSR